MFFIILLFIFILSFVLAVRSMKDFELPKDIQSLLSAKKVRGTIVFLKGKEPRHYSSSSGSSSR
ncbi:hypothetical protein HGA88_02090 [Candidatus Roizmanbacteria bacterium]|nr:hypothetical protein [Candidatus Roizmanbacteria bacterium]